MSRALGAFTWRGARPDGAGSGSLYRRVEQIDCKLAAAEAEMDEVLCGQLLAEKVDLLQQVFEQIRREG